MVTVDDTGTSAVKLIGLPFEGFGKGDRIIVVGGTVGVLVSVVVGVLVSVEVA